MIRTRTLLTFTGVAFAMAITADAPRVAAAVPTVLTQQGQLVDRTTGAPVTGSLSFKFSIYAASTGGAALWTETQTVTLDAGYFSAQLGGTTPSPPTLWDGAVKYVGVSIDGDAEMTPREALTSVPYALVAGNVNGDITPTTVSVGGATVIDGTGKWVGSPAGLQGPPGPAGDAGPPGPSGFVTSIESNGSHTGAPATAPANTFFGGTALVTITAGQNIDASGEIELAAVTTAQTWVGMCYSSSTTSTSGSSDWYMEPVILAGARTVVPAHTFLTGLAAGTYKVGFCGYSVSGTWATFSQWSKLTVKIFE